MKLIEESEFKEPMEPISEMLDWETQRNMLDSLDNREYQMDKNTLILNYEYSNEACQVINNVEEYIDKVKRYREEFDYRRVKHMLFDVCVNETGSFKLQEIFNSSPHADRVEVFTILKPHIYELMINKFGN